MFKKKKQVIVFVCFIPAIILLGMTCMLWGGISNPAGRGNIGDISTPRGFVRVPVEADSFGEYLRHVRLQKRGSHMKYFNGKIAYGQYFGYAVLDVPMLANSE